MPPVQVRSALAGITGIDRRLGGGTRRPLHCALRGPTIAVPWARPRATSRCIADYMLPRETAPVPKGNGSERRCKASSPSRWCRAPSRRGRRSISGTPRSKASGFGCFRRAKRDAITVEKLAERFVDHHVKNYVKESTGGEYQRGLRNYILPAFGKKAVSEVSHGDVARLHGLRLCDFSHIRVGSIVQP